MAATPANAARQWRWSVTHGNTGMRDSRTALARTVLLSASYLILCVVDVWVFGPLVESANCLVLPFGFIVVAFWLYRVPLCLYLLPAFAASLLMTPETSGVVIGAGALAFLTVLACLGPSFMAKAHAWRWMLLAGAAASVVASAIGTVHRTILYGVPPDLGTAFAGAFGQFGGVALLLLLLMSLFKALRSGAHTAGRPAALR